MNVVRIVAVALLAATSLSPSLLGQTDAVNLKAKPRARDLGIPFDGTPAPLNAITDLPGVEVGYTTLIQGEGKRVVGKGPVSTGVTSICIAENHQAKASLLPSIPATAMAT